MLRAEKTNEAKPERKDITETVFAPGTPEPEKYNLTAQTEGYILELRFDDGDTVKTAVLALIDNKTNAISAVSAENLLNLAGLNASKDGPTLRQAHQNMQLMHEKTPSDSLQNMRYQNYCEQQRIQTRKRKCKTDIPNIAHQLFKRRTELPSPETANRTTAHYAAFATRCERRINDNNELKPWLVARFTNDSGGRRLRAPRRCDCRDRGR